MGTVGSVWSDPAYGDADRHTDVYANIHTRTADSHADVYTDIYARTAYGDAYPRFARQRWVCIIL